MKYYCCYVYFSVEEPTTAIYVGVGDNFERAFCHLKKSHNPGFEQYLSRRRETGKLPIPVVTHLPDAKSAFAMEMKLIGTHGRLDLGTGTLFNRTDGGPGCKGKCFSEEERLSRSTHMKDRWAALTPEQKMERRAALSKALKGREITAAARAKHSATLKKAFAEGRPGVNTGKTFTAEHRAKLAAGIKKGWAKRKQALADGTAKVSTPEQREKARLRTAAYRAKQREQSASTK